jgi:hypothetical protein
MKQISTLFFVVIFATSITKAAPPTNISLNSNTSWNASYGSFVSATNFTIASGKTFTFDANATCANCTFTGGNIIISSTFSCQGCTFTNTNISMNNNKLNLQSSTNTFTNVSFALTGTSQIAGNSPVVATNSTFNFSGTSFLKQSFDITLTNSTFSFAGSSYVEATGGDFSLKSGSKLVAGDGTLASAAYIKMNGANLKIYDTSSLVLANNNNYYFNWSSYSSVTNSKSYSTASNTLNCGGSNPHACASPLVFGPVLMNSAGAAVTTILPVNMYGFTVALKNNGVELKWNTQQEMNSSYFSIERSVDGNYWTSIGTVSAKGNSAIISNYSFNDNQTVTGTIYYRLKEVDTDQKFQYSAVKVVRTATVKSISMFPNPAQNFVNISFGETNNTEMNVRLMNQAGQVLQERKANGNTTVNLSVQQYNPGMYVVVISNAQGFSQTSKLVIAAH